MKGRIFGPRNDDYCPPSFVDRETAEGIQRGGWCNEVQ